MSTYLYDNRILRESPAYQAPVSSSQLVENFTGSIFDAGCSLVSSASGVYALSTPADRDPTLDVFYDCAGTDSSNNADQGVLVLTTTVSGTWISITIAADKPIFRWWKDKWETFWDTILNGWNKREVIYGVDLFATIYPVQLTLLGTFIESITISAGLLELNISLKPNDVYIPFAGPEKKNWVRWSNIGSLDFTVSRDNVAGERPLNWSGYVYSLRKLGNKVAVYGQGGVSLLIPSNITYGLQPIYSVGLKGKNAITGDETKQFFIDSTNKLWKLSDSLALLDYSEYLSTLVDSVVMSYDASSNFVYICDGIYGYVYNTVTGSFGKCSAKITGIGYKEGIQYVAASSTIVTDPFEICTDIYDLGSRTGKTVFNLELGTDVVTTLYAAIDYRRSKSDNFIQTPWYEVAATGRVFITAWGREFRFRVKTLEYEDFELDYIKVNGDADAY